MRDSLGLLSLSLPFSPTPSPWLLQLQPFFQGFPRPKTNLNPRLCLAILFTGAPYLSQGGTFAEPNTEPDETESIGAEAIARAANFSFKINNFPKKTQLNIF